MLLYPERRALSKQSVYVLGENLNKANLYAKVQMILYWFYHRCSKIFVNEQLFLVQMSPRRRCDGFLVEPEKVVS